MAASSASCTCTRLTSQLFIYLAFVLPQSKILMSSQRSFADTKGPDGAVLPGVPPQAPSVTGVIPKAAPGAPLVPAQNMPLTPPTPQEVNASPPTISTPPPPAPPAPKPKKRRGRRFLLSLLLLSGFGYAGGVYYALTNDNFHDFFTEYVPFGEEAVLFFEEREFKRRFPKQAVEVKLYPQTSGEGKQTFSGRSGVSAKVASAAEHNASKPSPSPTDILGKTDRAVAEPAKAATPNEAKPAAKAPEPKKDAPKIATIDPLKIDNAADPVVQKITQILNDVITVVNADNASGKYSSALTKAKESVEALAADVTKFQASASKEAQEKIRQSQLDFDNGARELIKRIEQEQADQELQWREEYEKERQRLADSYNEKLKAEIEATQKVADQRLDNQLLEQSIKLQEKFASQVKASVESERSARLSKLNDLSHSVEDLEQLTAQWSQVVDTNLKTQHLVVAVDAVKALIESSDRPRAFVHELAALKEIAADNAVVSAAIASIKPAAYQRGMPTPAQLIDRFRRVASEVRKASLLPEDAGAASHAASLLLSKVMFKKQGLAVGDDVESILTRTETYLEEGNLDEATREMNGLQGWAKVLSRDWLNECRTVLEVKQALDVSLFSSLLSLPMQTRLTCKI